MSCGGNRHKFFKQQSQTNQALLNVFGGNAHAAQEALERIFQAAKSDSDQNGSPQNAAALNLATARTRALFDQMKQAGIKPPTHAKNGLPKNSSRFGYAAVHQALKDIEAGEEPQGMARNIIQGVKKKYRVGQSGADAYISALAFDQHGYYRCKNCGRFASLTREHVCPATASEDDLARMLERRLGISKTAFTGYRGRALESILGAARDSGEVEMLHQLTGQRARVTLDGIPQAMMQGYVPSDWVGQTQVVQAEDGRLVSVVNAEGLQAMSPADAAVQQVAASYGVAIPPTAPIMLASQSQAPLQVIQPAAEMELDGGQEYDHGHLIGTEYRKASAKGTFVEIDGKRYGIYARTSRPEDASSARGLFAPQVKNIVVGRNLPAAVEILHRGSVAETKDGLVQVYSSDGKLLAVYDPRTRTAGDTDGNTNASAAQMAAIMAHRMLHPQNAFDHAMIHDFGAFKSGQGSPIAVSDSAYLSLITTIDAQDFVLGARVRPRRCPQCGQFIGASGHTCPAEQKKTRPKPKPRPPVVVQADPAAPIPQPEPAQINAPAPVQLVIPDDFAQTIAAAVGGILKASPQPHQEGVATTMAQIASAVEQLAQIMQAQQKVIEELSNRPPQQVLVPGGDGAPVTPVTDVQALTSAISQAIKATGVGSTSGGKSRCPKCGQFMGTDHTCPPRVERKGLQRPAGLPLTDQEKILGDVELPAPNLYLDSVPEEWGGQRAVPIPEDIPELNPEYQMGAQEKKIFQAMATMLKIKSNKPWNRSFGLYGPAGTGKNTIARQLAASLKTDDGKQGLPYAEVNVTPDMDIAQAIGEVVLTTDENGATVSRVRLGPIGTIAASGGVISINEIVRSPKLATALQSMIEDGELSVPTPEGGTVKVPVHPSAIFVSTWNPGYEGDADRPAQAPLSRMTTFRLNYPSRKEQTERLRSFFVKNGLPEPEKATLTAAVDFWNEVRVLTGDTGQEPQIGTLSPTRTTPGPREMSRFLLLGQTQGWEAAMDSLYIICDQDPELFAVQSQVLRERFEAHFGIAL